MKVAIVAKNFKGTDLFVLEWQRYNFSNMQKMYKFQFYPLHCHSRNAIFSKVFDEFSKTFFLLQDMELGYCGWKFQGLRYFGFAMATLQLFPHPENVKSSIIPFTLSQQKCYIFESI